MRLTAHTDYALRVLIYAAVEPAALCTIKRISKAYGVSRNHLMKVVQRLGDYGFLETVRGRGGGLRLAMPASEISVGDVVRRMEDDLNQAECFRDQNACVITPACGLKHALSAALDAYLNALDQFTIADITRKRKALSRLLELGPVS
ncbi:Rrf2 family transcriptional regulator [Hyphococcus sp.]|uniref:Rrf2 family transcriptional regulator n=1 Tax=Hyphococcus sp. TaxID=2038636 RepID=UPI002088C7BF|nr:MAG: HTH-type transcriptional regulator NsrR [Marinicaulis sp.]